MAIMSSRICYPMNQLPPPVKRIGSSVKMSVCSSVRCQCLIVETPVTVEELQVSESVTRRLILLRHAKSSWEFPSLRGTRIG